VSGLTTCHLDRKAIMAIPRWTPYAAVFGAGALTVLGVWGVVALVGPQAAAPAATNPAPQASPSQTATADGTTPIGSLQRNTLVTISGTVERVADEDEFFLQDATGSVKVWTGGAIIPVAPGETLTVRGFVDDDLVMEVYAQEIIRANGEQVAVSRNDQPSREPAEATAVDQAPMSQGVTPIGNLVRNSFVTIQGTVERVSDEDEFFIQDGTGSVKVWTGGTFFTVSPGEQVTVEGFVDEDLLLEVYAQRIINSDGEVTTIGGYE